MLSIKGIIIEAAICALAFLITGNIFVINGLICFFAVFNFLKEYLKTGKVRPLSLITYAVIIAACVATIYFRSPLFIKWKVSLAFVFTAFFILFSPYISKTPVIKNLVGEFFNLRLKEMQTINTALGLLMLGISIINIIVLSYFNDAEWLFFKTILVPLMFLLFIVFVFLLYRDRIHKKSDKKQRNKRSL